MVNEVIIRENDDVMDEIEAIIADECGDELPLDDLFIGGMYIRGCKFFKGSMATSRIHKTHNSFWVLKGKISVWNDFKEEQIITAPFWGETLIGTRRLFYAHEETVWVTFHPTEIVPENGTEEAKLAARKIMEERLFENRVNPLLNSQKLIA